MKEDETASTAGQLTSEIMRELHPITERALAADERPSDPNVGVQRAHSHSSGDQTWRRVLSGFVTLTTLTVAIALGAIYLLVSQGV